MCLGARNEGFIFSAQNASVAHSIEAQTQIVKNYNWAEMEVLLEVPGAKSKIKSRWYLLIHKSCTLRELVSVCAARLNYASDITLDENLDTIVIGISESKNFTQDNRKIILGVFDSFDENDKINIIKHDKSVKNEDRMSTFDKIRRKIICEENCLGKNFREFDSNFEEDTHFQDIVKSIPNLNIKRKELYKFIVFYYIETFLLFIYIFL